MRHGDLLGGIWKQADNKAGREHRLKLPQLALDQIGKGTDPKALVFPGEVGTKIGADQQAESRARRGERRRATGGSTISGEPAASLMQEIRRSGNRHPRRAQPSRSQASAKSICAASSIARRPRRWRMVRRARAHHRRSARRVVSDEHDPLRIRLTSLAAKTATAEAVAIPAWRIGDQAGERRAHDDLASGRLFWRQAHDAACRGLEALERGDRDMAELYRVGRVRRLHCRHRDPPQAGRPGNAGTVGLTTWAPTRQEKLKKKSPRYFLTENMVGYVRLRFQEGATDERPALRVFSLQGSQGRRHRFEPL